MTIPAFMLNAAERLAQEQRCQVGIEPAGDIFRLVGRYDRRRQPLVALVYPSGEIDYLSTSPQGDLLVNGEEPNISWARRYAPELIPSNFPDPREARP